MEIRSIRHKGLRRLVEDDDSRGIRSDLTVRMRSILAALISAADMDAVQGPPGWRIHQLSGDRAGTWSISASGNWRITFDIKDGLISNLNLGACAVGKLATIYSGVRSFITTTYGA